MSYRIICLLTAFLVLPVFASMAQQAIPTTGGDITGPGGSMSNSSGLTDYMYFKSDVFSLQFGVQQAESIHLLSIGTEPMVGGTILGAGNHPIGSEVPLTALPGVGYEFVMWVGTFTEVFPNKSGSQSTNNPITILIEEGTIIQAVFQLSNPVAIPISNWSLLLGVFLIICFPIIRYFKSVL